MDKLISTFQKLGTKEKTGVIGLIFISFLIGLGIPFLLSQSPRNQQLTTHPSTPLRTGNLPLISPTPLPKVAEVSLATDKTTVYRGNKFNVDIVLATPKETEAADFGLRFDPRYLRANSVASGIYFREYPVEKIATGSVKISAAAKLVGNKIMVPRGRGVVATINFSALTATSSTELVFDPLKTSVASEGQEILATSSGLVISIK